MLTTGIYQHPPSSPETTRLAIHRCLPLSKAGHLLLHLIERNRYPSSRVLSSTKYLGMSIISKRG